MATPNSLLVRCRVLSSSSREFALALLLGLVFFLGGIYPALGQTSPPSPAGSALLLSGTNYVRSNYIGDGFWDLTFELWFKAAGPGVLIGEVHKDDPALWDFALAAISSTGVITVGVQGLTPINAGTISFDSWHHLACVYDRAAKTFSAYLDGSPAGVSHGERASPEAAGVYCIGRGGPTNLGDGGFFVGLVDEVRLWSRALSAAEIAFQFDKVISVNDLSLRYYWHFDTVVAGKTYMSPGTLASHEAIHVPQKTMPLIASTAPLVNDPRPSVLSLTATPVASGTVELNGTVNPNGTETFIYFDYALGANTPQQTAVRSIGSGTNQVSFTEVVPDLQIAAGYNYHLVTSNAFGIITSLEKSFAPITWAGYAYQTTFSLFQPGPFLRTTTNQNGFFPGSDITVELWFNLDYPGVLVSETDFSSAYDRSVIEISSGAQAQVRAAFNGLPPMTLGDVRSNVWNHVALRYNSSSQTLDGFLNGSKCATATGVRVTPKDLGLQGQFAFGRGAQSALDFGRSFLGMLDEIRVWNVPRSDEDLTTARFNLLAGDEPGLVFNWRGDAAGQVISDLSPNGNNGQNHDCGIYSSTAPLVFGIRRQGDSQIETQFAMKGGAAYRIEASSNLLFWTPISTNTAPASGLVRLPQQTSSDALFFRAVPQ